MPHSQSQILQKELKALGGMNQMRERLVIGQNKASTVPVTGMQLIGQIYKIILYARIWSWTKQYNLSTNANNCAHQKQARFCTNMVQQAMFNTSHQCMKQKYI